MAVVNQYKFVGIDNNTSGSALTPFGSGNPLVSETYLIKSILDFVRSIFNFQTPAFFTLQKKAPQSGV